MNTERDFENNPFQVWQCTFKRQSSSKEGTMLRIRRDSYWLSTILDHPFLTQRLSCAELINHEMSEKQVRILATLIPDTVLNLENPWQKDFDSCVGVLLVADVSGFTPLCEKYAGFGQSGTYRLTAALNGYLGAMVEVIYSYGGDVLKFSGDALLALWKVNHDQFISTAIHQVIACALFIQETIHSCPSGVEVDLKVKLMIAAGNMSLCVIGTDRSQHFIVIGEPINDIKEASKVCSSGEVIIAASAWAHCSARSYNYTECCNGHVMVRKILYNPANQRLEIFRIPVLHSNWIDRLQQASHYSSKTSIASQDFFPQREDKNDQHLNTRSSVAGALRRNLGASLRPFLIPPVIQQIDSDQPLEYLTEMRQVTTMFVNVMHENLSDKQLIQLVDDVYCTVSRLVYHAQGCVNKVSLFDKDLMLLVVFGLRGFKHDQESRSGLQCGFGVRHAIIHNPGVKTVSVGITTGMVYCGVVGHPMRQEYTVIGAPVNKAARIMCAYPDRVTCERATCLQSSLPAQFFIQQESRPLKGIGAAGLIYEYTEEHGLSATQVHQKKIHLPILGQEELMGKLEYLIHTTRLCKPLGVHHGVVLQGDTGAGKSRLLREVINKARCYGLKTHLCLLQPRHATRPYATIQFICQQVCGATSDFETQERIVSLLKGTTVTNNLCCLNPILGLQFPVTELLQSLQPIQLRELAATVILAITQRVTSPTLIAVDNLQLMDEHSWRLCYELLCLKETTAPPSPANTLVVGSLLQRRNEIPESAVSVLHHPAVMVHPIPGLPNIFLAPLACQFLSASAVDPEIVRILESHSRGNPGWCANYLSALLQSGSLVLQPMNGKEIKAKGLIIPDPETLNLRVQGQQRSELLMLYDSSWSLTDSFETGSREKKQQLQKQSSCSTTSSEMLCSPENSITVLQGRQSHESATFDKEIINHDQASQVFLSSFSNWSEHCSSVTSDPSSCGIVKKVHDPVEHDTNIKMKQACVLTSRKECDEKAAIHVNGIIVSAFDCLPPNDQLLLKCACVLGDTFTRGMLVAILQTVKKSSLWQIALVVKRLFDLRVLECAAETVVNTTKDSQSANVGISNECYCVLSSEEHQTEAEADLPRYAFCKMLRFHVPTFQKAICDLLPGNQKRRFHICAIHYLEQFPLVCQSCTTASSCSSTESAMKEEDKVLSQSVASKRNSDVTGDQTNKSASTSTPNSHPVTLSVINRLPWASFLPWLQSCIFKKKVQVDVESYLSRINFPECDCLYLQAEVFKQLTEHCFAANLKSKHIYFMTQLGSVSIQAGNLQEALAILEKAQHLVKEAIQEEKCARSNPKRDRWLLPLGRVLTLTGQAYITLGETETAHHYLLEALSTLAVWWPENIQPHFRSQRLLSTLLSLHIASFSKLQAKKCWFCTHSSHEDCLLKAACLALISNTYTMKGDYLWARTAALASLHFASRAGGQDHRELCAAISCTLEVNLGSPKMEAHALRCVQNLAIEIRCAVHVCAVARLLFSVFVFRPVVFVLHYFMFMSRLRQGNVEGASEIVGTILKAAEQIGAVRAQFIILPLMIRIMLLKGDLVLAVQTLNKLRVNMGKLSDGNISKYAFSNYHLLQMDILLDFNKPSNEEERTGIVQEASTYVRSLLTAQQDAALECRIIIRLWLWYARLGDRRSARLWQNLAGKRSERLLVPLTGHSDWSALRLLEVFIITCTSRGFLRFTGTNDWVHRVRALITELGHVARHVPLILPRLMHLHAYWLVLHGGSLHIMYCIYQLRAAIRLAVVHGNVFEAMWCEHHLKVWSGNGASRSDECIDFFSLPLFNNC